VRDSKLVFDFACAITLCRPDKKQSGTIIIIHKLWVLNFILKVEAMPVYVKDFHVPVVLLLATLHAEYTCAVFYNS
jgi:hypothetical protein